MKPETAILGKLKSWPLATFWELDFPKGPHRFPKGESGSACPHCLRSKAAHAAHLPAPFWWGRASEILVHATS